MTEAEWLSSTDPAAMLASVQHTTTTNHIYWISDRQLRLWACACCRAVWDGTPCPRCDGVVATWAGKQPNPANCHRCRGTGKVGGLTDPRSRRAVDVAERFADGEATKKDMYEAGLETVEGGAWAVTVPTASEAARLVAEDGMFRDCRPVQCHLLRSIVGNPFRPVTLRRGIKAAAINCPIGIECPHGRDVCSICDAEYAEPWATNTNVLALAAAIQGGEKCSACWNTYLKQNCTLCFGSGRTPFDADPAAWLILADALEEAGCTDAAILNHCRGNVLCDECMKKPDEVNHPRGMMFVGWGHGWQPCSSCSGLGWRPSPVPHVRGDWVLDLILGLS